MKHKDKAWLRQKFLFENKTLKEVSEEAGVSISCIHKYVKIFGLKKNKEQKEKIKQRKEEKRRESCKNKYGVENPMLNSEFARKQEATMLAKHGVRNPLQNKKILKKFKNTCLDRYGVESPLSSEDIRQKQAETMISRYGVENPMHSKEIKKKVRLTNLKKYGYTTPSQHPDIKKKSKENYNKNNGIFYKNEFFSKKEFCKIKNISHYWFTKWINSLEYYDDILIDSWIEDFTYYETNIETEFKNLTSLEFFNKKFDKKLYSSLRYKPDFKLNEKTAINVDGLYWHSEKGYVDKYYHFIMRKEYEKLGLRILQFREDEIFYKPNIILSIINHINGNSTEKIFARKCKIKTIKQKEASNFLDNNHMMGSINAKHIGLYFKDKLVSTLSYKIFGKTLKIERFCSKINHSIVGGFSKLLKNLEKNNNICYIESWVDLRYGNGHSLEKNGFKKEKEVLSWRWTNFKETFNRLQCRANMDDRKLSEAEHAKELGWYKIYDAGQRLYKKDLNRES